MYVFRNAFIPYDGNSTREKVVLYAVVFVWAALELGIAFHGIEPPASIEWMRYFVMLVLGRQYGVEVGRFSQRPPGSSVGEGRSDVQRRLRKTDHSDLEYPDQGKNQGDSDTNSGE